MTLTLDPVSFYILLSSVYNLLQFLLMNLDKILISVLVRIYSLKNRYKARLL